MEEQDDFEVVAEMVRRDPSLVFVIASLYFFAAMMMVVDFIGGIFALIFFTGMLKWKVERWKRQNLSRAG